MNIKIKVSIFKMFFFYYIHILTNKTKLKLKVFTIKKVLFKKYISQANIVLFLNSFIIIFLHLFHSLWLFITPILKNIYQVNQTNNKCMYVYIYIILKLIFIS